MNSGIAGHLLFYIILLLVVLFGNFLSTYFRRKGENLATSQDIEKITQKVEEVRFLFAEKLTKISSENQLRMAALDRRLEAHQEAYALWSKLMKNTNNAQEAGKVFVECQDWWDKNCLFLEPQVRQAFQSASSAAWIHPDLLKAKRDPKAIKENYLKISAAGQVIQVAVGLPAIAGLAKEDALAQPSPGTDR